MLTSAIDVLPWRQCVNVGHDGGGVLAVFCLVVIENIRSNIFSFYCQS